MVFQKQIHVVWNQYPRKVPNHCCLAHKKHSNLNRKSKNYIQNCFSKGNLIKTRFYLKKVIIKRRLCRCWISTSKRRLRIISEQCNVGIICYTRRHDQKERLIIKRQPEKQWFEDRALGTPVDTSISRTICTEITFNSNVF